MSEAYPKTWIRLPGALVGRTTHWQRIADASPHSRWAWTRAHGFGMSMTRSPGWSVSGLAAASSARSMPYLAISSAALAVSASASGGVVPADSALASSLRTRSRSVLLLVIDGDPFNAGADAAVRGPGCPGPRTGEEVQPPLAVPASGLPLPASWPGLGSA